MPGRSVQALPPKWISGDAEAPGGLKDMGGWNARVFTEEQQSRLGVDEAGKSVATAAPEEPKPMFGGNPHLNRMETIEEPEGGHRVGNRSKGRHHDGWSESGMQLDGCSVPNQQVQAVGPAWLRSGQEKPEGTKDMGSWVAAVFTKEQQVRLGVDEFGKKKLHLPDKAAPKVRGLGPTWTRGEVEAPGAEKDMGGWTAAVYTEEQQTRLNVDAFGEKVGKQKSKLQGLSCFPAAGGSSEIAAYGSRSCMDPR